MNKKPKKIPWQRWPEAIRLFLRGVTLSTSLRVALVVGVILSIINQCDDIINDTATLLTWCQIFMNFVIPFCVSSYGYLMACRTDEGSSCNETP